MYSHKVICISYLISPSLINTFFYNQPGPQETVIYLLLLTEKNVGWGGDIIACRKADSKERKGFLGEKIGHPIQLKLHSPVACSF